jgi:hypothetical protein
MWSHKTIPHHMPSQSGLKLTSMASMMMVIGCIAYWTGAGVGSVIVRLYRLDYIGGLVPHWLCRYVASITSLYKLYLKIFL